MMTFGKSIYSKLFLSHVLAVFLVSGSIGTFFYSRASQSILVGLQERLKATAAMVSWTIDADTLRHIRTREDVNDPQYQHTLAQLRALKRMNTDISFLYIMRIEDGRVLFVVDSDESDAQAMPGHEYSAVVPTLLHGFLGVTVDDAPTDDDWGSFLSSYAPLRGSHGDFLVGVDMRADAIQEKYENLRISALISVIASILLAFLFARMLSTRFMTPINMTIRGCSDMASGKLETRIPLNANDGFDQLLTAFNSMADTLSTAEKVKNETFEALNQSRNELSIRVEQRTSDLKEMNDKLSNEVAMRLVAQKALEEAASVDMLTRLWNRRFMIDRLEQEINRFKRSQSPFTILMMDLDHFKEINDCRGHAAGDAILEETAMRMKSMLRSQDAACRWGGEEFLILLPDTTPEQGALVAEKLRSRMADAPYFVIGEAVTLTASFGVTGYDGQLEALDIVATADKAMYEAKKKGRNRVEAL
jgi:diguanylate cyclase (GGDEF) domain